MSKPKKNIEVANEIIKLMETDSTSWEKSWDISKSGTCINAFTNTPYKGLNFMMLLAKIKKNKYKDGRFLTYAQCKQLGGNIKQGEKATTLVHYSEYDKKTKKQFNPADLKAQGKSEKEITEYKNENVYTYIKPFWVFNVSQCQNLKLPELKGLNEKELIKRTNKICEEIIKNSPAAIYNDGIDSAYYNPEDDSIHMPEKRIFNSIDDFYATILHEISHSTGHKSRLNRNVKNVFGTKEYSVEECIAEFAATMLQNQAKINLKGKPIKQSAGYIKSWLDNTKANDRPYELLKIINQADKAAQYVLNNCLSKNFIKDLDKKQETQSVDNKQVQIQK